MVGKADKQEAVEGRDQTATEAKPRQMANGQLAGKGEMGESDESEKPSRVIS